MRRLQIIADSLTTVLLLIGATALTLMMLLTASDVVLRYALNRPLSGAFELVEYMMAVLVPFSIVYCARRKEHVAVDLLVNFFPAGLRRIFEVGASLLTAAFAGCVAWQSGLYVTSMLASKMTSAVLLIPVYPFVAAVALGMGAFALISLISVLDLLRRAPV